MTRAINVLIVHGIGSNRSKIYARPLEEGLRRAFDQAIKRLKISSDLKRHARAKEALRFEAVCWDPVTQAPQDALLRLMFGRAGLFGRFNITRMMRKNMIALLGDVTCYERDPNNRVYNAIHHEVEQCMDSLSKASADERDEFGFAPLTIIGHSLGSVIASDYVWDHTRSSGHTHFMLDHHFALINMILMGSPMGLYTLRNNTFGGRDSIREALDSPVQIEPEHGVWLNIYDRHDPIAFPLEPVEAYKEEGVIDHEVRVGSWLTSWNLSCHTAYWRSAEVATVIANKLALDWARFNDPPFAEREYPKAVEKYRKDLRK